MSAFEILKNNCQTKQKPIIKFDELPIGEHFIYEFKLVDVKFNATLSSRLLLDLGDGIVFLPERYSEKLTIEAVKDLNKMRTMLVYNGKDPAKRNKLKIDFKQQDVNQLTEKF